MVRNQNERTNERKRLRERFTNLEREVRLLSTRLERLQVEEGNREEPYVAPIPKHRNLPLKSNQETESDPLTHHITSDNVV